MICQEKDEKRPKDKRKVFHYLFTYPFYEFPSNEGLQQRKRRRDIVCYSRLLYIAQFITWCLTKRKNRRHTRISRYVFSLFKLIKEKILWKLKWKLIFWVRLKISNLYSTEMKKLFKPKMIYVLTYILYFVVGKKSLRSDNSLAAITIDRGHHIDIINVCEMNKQVYLLSYYAF